MDSRKKIFSCLLSALVCVLAVTPTNGIAQLQTVSVAYDNRELVDFVNDMAAHKGVNIVLPLGANAIKAKLNLKIDEPLSIDEAWHLLGTVLSLADYRLLEKANHYTIVKSSKETAKEAVKQLYINTPRQEIPTSDELVRYMLHLEHIRIPSEGDSELAKVVTGILPEGSIGKVDAGSNSVLIAAPAKSVRAAVKVIKALDTPGLQERMELIRLQHATAATVAKVFNDEILKQGDDRYRLDNKKKIENPPFFRNIRIVPDQRTNSLIVIGKSLAVERVKNFVLDYMDVELDSGRSVIHTYKLQYLNAEEIEPVLKRIVESARTGGTEQSRTGASTAGGPERFFEEVVIKADRPRDPEKNKYYGGNRLIIVARNDDWQSIKKIIEQLDKPLPQVFIEVLIAELTIEDSRLLGSITRSPARIPLPGGINFQTNHAASTPGTTTNSDSNPKTIGIIEEPARLVADLLGSGSTRGSGTSTTKDGTTTYTPPVNLNATSGAVNISLNDSDGQTWSILQLLKVFKHSKILAHPHIIATHNKEASITTGEARILTGQVVSGENNNNYRRNDRVDAYNNVKITPRISYASQYKPGSVDTINLDVEVDISNFINTVGDKNDHKIITNTSLSNNSILAIGGLVQTRSTTGLSETPGISKIPVIGWLFKKRTGEMEKKTLTVFIRPTIIEPHARSTIANISQDYISIARIQSGEGALFDSLKDPVTRWFFDPKNETDKKIDRFLQKDKTQNASPEVKTIITTQHQDRQKETPPKQASLSELLEQEENPFSRAKTQITARG